jgi:predicted nucleotidyltransferase component of viral defense system/virulence-associated protein VapD
MISPESFTKAWINSHKKEKQFSRINPPVLEKMIRALALLEALAIHKLKFIFKGGTSLILLLSEPRRFSVDIDILTEHSREELEAVFNKIKESGTFKSWELDEPRSYKAGVPKAHYFFYFDPQLNKDAGYILLDVLFEKHQYPNIIVAPVRSNWVKIDGEPITVEVPSIESILGDKLTAFAPNTTGVPYEKDKSLEIVKQLYDVGHLFDHISDVNIVAQSFHRIVSQEIKYRALEVTAEHILDDIIATALLIGKTEKHHTDDEKSKYAEIRRGMDQFGNFLMTGNFYIDTAIESSAKAAYLAAKLKVKDFSALQRYVNDDISFQFETMPFNTLNRLRKIRNGSLFYWSKVAELLSIK